MSDGWSEGGTVTAPVAYPGLIDIVTKRYFDGVDTKALDRVLDCFTDDAILTEVTSATVHDGKPAIAAMFRKLFADFSAIWHGNFVHVADPATNAICSQFTVLITPHGGDELRYENCNRFYLNGDRFHRVYVYMSGDNLLRQGRRLMQYAATLDRAGLIDLALHRYFASVDAKDLDAVLACFHDEAVLTVQTAFATHAGKPALARMFTDLFAQWERLVHRDFTCTVDAAHGRIAASFEAVLTAADGSVTRLANTNFWRVRDGRFQEVHVYMSGANVLV